LCLNHSRQSQQVKERQQKSVLLHFLAPCGGTLRGQAPTSLGCGIVEIDAWGFGESREEKNLSRVKITLLESAGKDKDETERTKTSLVLGDILLRGSSPTVKEGLTSLLASI